MKPLTIALGVIFAGGISATPIPGPGDYIGSRAVGSGVEAFAHWSGTGNNGFAIAWEVTDSGPGLTPWTYRYTLSGSDGESDLSKALSHMIIQLSENVPDASYVFPDGADSEGPRVYDPESGGNSNFGMPGAMFGIKWNCGAACNSATFTIVTSQAPMWGSFYAISGKKRGEETYAYNSGFGTVPAEFATDFTNWIVTPDTRTNLVDGPAVPEPATWVLMAAGLGLAAGLRYRRASSR
jgi:hypothetical protein